MTFDDATEADLLVGVDNFASKTIVENPISLVDESALDADGTYGKILQFHREPVGRHWSNLKFTHAFDGTRKFWFTWDHYFDMPFGSCRHRKATICPLTPRRTSGRIPLKPAHR